MGCAVGTTHDSTALRDTPRPRAGADAPPDATLSPIQLGSGDVSSPDEPPLEPECCAPQVVESPTTVHGAVGVCEIITNGTCDEAAPLEPGRSHQSSWDRSHHLRPSWRSDSENSFPEVEVIWIPRLGFAQVLLPRGPKEKGDEDGGTPASRSLTANPFDTPRHSVRSYSSAGSVPLGYDPCDVNGIIPHGAELDQWVE